MQRPTGARFVTVHRRSADDIRYLQEYPHTGRRDPNNLVTHGFKLRTSSLPGNIHVHLVTEVFFPDIPLEVNDNIIGVFSDGDATFADATQLNHEALMNRLALDNNPVVLLKVDRLDDAQMAQTGALRDLRQLQLPSRPPREEPDGYHKVAVRHRNRNEILRLRARPYNPDNVPNYGFAFSTKASTGGHMHKVTRVFFRGIPLQVGDIIVALLDPDANEIDCRTINRDALKEYLTRSNPDVNLTVFRPIDTENVRPMPDDTRPPARAAPRTPRMPVTLPGVRGIRASFIDTCV